MGISMVDQDFARMASVGLNFLRLGCMWPGVEPTRGQYNYSYLAELEKIVNGAARYGIYTLLDMHQDGLSEYFCGEGIPVWAVRQTREFKQAGELAFPFPFDHMDNATDFFNDPVYAGTPRVSTRQACQNHKF